MLGAKKHFHGATRIRRKTPSRTKIRCADNGAAVEAYSTKFRFALESPFTRPPYTALPPSAALFNNAKVELLLFLIGLDR